MAVRKKGAAKPLGRAPSAALAAKKASKGSKVRTAKAAKAPSAKAPKAARAGKAKAPKAAPAKATKAATAKAPKAAAGAAGKAASSVRSNANAKATKAKATKAKSASAQRSPAPARIERLPPSAPEAREEDSPVAAQALAPDATSSASGGSRGKYVYCVIHADRSLGFGPLGIGSDSPDVHTVNYKDIAAVVSDTPIAVHEPTRANVLAHERVNETVMRNHTVIPMSFGTVFKTREDIHELLRSAYDAFKDVLVKMEDKLEFGLKVLWDRDLVVKQLETENEEIRRLKSEISSQRGSTYFARMQYGRLVDASLQARSDRYVQEIFEALRPVSVASRANKPIGDRMIMNAAFLVRREREGEFDAVVKRIGAAHDKLTFRYTGPWPPYNFVNIRLKLERA